MANDKRKTGVCLTEFCSQLTDAGYLVDVSTSEVSGKFSTVGVEIMSPNGTHDTKLTLSGKSSTLRLDRPRIVSALTALGFFGLGPRLGSGR